MRMLAHRIADPRVLRLIERWLEAGVLESGQWRAVEAGTRKGRGSARSSPMSACSRAGASRWLRQVLNGHYQYSGVIFNYRSLRVFKDCVVNQSRRALGQRSQKGRMSWAAYRQLLTAFPLGTGDPPGLEAMINPPSGPF